MRPQVAGQCPKETPSGDTPNRQRGVLTLSARPECAGFAGTFFASLSVATLQPGGTIMKLSDLKPIASLSLRPLGLDPGRAVANARPTPAQLRERRKEQLQYIVRHFPPPDGAELPNISNR